MRVAVASKDISYSFHGGHALVADGRRRSISKPDAAVASDYQTFVTLPDVEAPILTVTSPDRDPAAGDILTSNGLRPGPLRAADLQPAGPADLV